MFILFSCVALIANKTIWTFTCMLPSDMIGDVIFVHACVLAEMTLKVWNNFTTCALLWWLSSPLSVWKLFLQILHAWVVPCLSFMCLLKELKARFFSQILHPEHRIQSIYRSAVKTLFEVFPTKYISFTGLNATLFIHLHKSSFGEKICSKNLWEFRGASFWSVQGITIRPPEFSEKSCKPPWFFLLYSKTILDLKKAPLIFLQHFLSPPENKQAKLMPPWILHSKTQCWLRSKTAIFNLLIQGGFAHQKCYARVQPGHRVARKGTREVTLSYVWADVPTMHCWRLSVARDWVIQCFSSMYMGL